MSLRIRNRRKSSLRLLPQEIIFESVENDYYLYLLSFDAYHAEREWGFQVVASLESERRLGAIYTGYSDSILHCFRVANRVLAEKPWLFYKSRSRDVSIFAKRQIKYLSRKKLTVEEALRRVRESKDTK